MPYLLFKACCLPFNVVYGVLQHIYILNPHVLKSTKFWLSFFISVMIKRSFSICRVVEYAMWSSNPISSSFLLKKTKQKTNYVSQLPLKFLWPAGWGLYRGVRLAVLYNMSILFFIFFVQQLQTKVCEAPGDGVESQENVWLIESL